MLLYFRLLAGAALLVIVAPLLLAGLILSALPRREDRRR